jgi:hypothetical protein
MSPAGHCLYYSDAGRTPARRKAIATGAISALRPELHAHRAATPTHPKPRPKPKP